MLRYTIDCVANAQYDLGYRVTLLHGRAKFFSEQRYASYESARRAAKATGAIPDDEFRKAKRAPSKSQAMQEA